jgi:hypothetical protein
MGDSERKPQGWHSRRHQTNEAQMEAREAFRTRSERRPRQTWDDNRKEWVKS